MGHKLTKRTYKGKRSSLLAHRKTRKREAIKCQHLPTVLNLNCRSVCNKREELTQLLEDSKADIVVLTETWVTRDNEQIIINDISRNNPAYEVISARRSKDGIDRGGGVMVLVNKDFSPTVTVISSTTTDDDSSGLLEALIVQTHQPRRPREFTSCIIAGAYIPPESDSNSKLALKSLNGLLSDAKLSSGSGSNPLVFVMGDMNRCAVGPINQSHGLRQLNNKATRGKKVLDPILSNAPRCYRTITSDPLASADHKIVKAVPLLNSYSKTRPKTSKTRKRAGLIGETVEQLGNIDWQQLISSKHHTAQAKFDVFYDTVKDVLDTCQPWRTSRRKGDKPWVTDELKSEIAIRQRLYHQQQHAEWKAQSNKVAHMIRKLKRAAHRKLANATSNWWREVNELRSAPTKHNGNQKECDELNRYFSSIWEEQQTAKRTTKSTRDESGQPTAEDIADLAEFNQHNILLELKKLDPKKAPGPDGLPPSLLKAARYELIDIIQHLFTLSFLTGHVPQQWKDANIVPIPKVPRPREEADYRGISLTSTLCKVFERILSRQLLHRTKHIWKTNDQHGFLPGKCTSDVTTKVIDDWSRAIDNKQTVYAIFFDFSKAFDLVDHELLLKKLRDLLPPMSTKWIANYLSDRQQRVKTTEHTSSWAAVQSGVIQGSVLGPTLFILFIADLNDRIPEGGKAPKYADDILAYSILRALVQLAADRINEWTMENKMRLNKKTLCMVLGKHNDKTPITIGGDAIGITNQYKYLGTIVDSKLDMDVHWEHVSNGFNSTLYLLKTLRQLGFNQRALVNVYKSLISSQIAANATTLCSISESAKRDMLAIQKRALRIMNVKENDLSSFKIKGIDELIAERCTLQMEKILADSSHPITLGLQKRTNVITRNNFEYIIPRCNTVRHQNSFIPKLTRQMEANTTKHTTTASKTVSAPALKPKTTCTICGKSFIRLKMHLRVHQKDNNTPVEADYSKLPDFNNNYEHVTTRRPHSNKTQ